MNDGLLVETIRCGVTCRMVDGVSVPMVELYVFVLGLRMHLHVPLDAAMKLVGEIDEAIGDIKEPRE